MATAAEDDTQIQLQEKTEEVEQVEEPVERYENKVEEMTSIALISALIFGFSMTIWIGMNIYCRFCRSHIRTYKVQNSIKCYFRTKMLV